MPHAGQRNGCAAGGDKGDIGHALHERRKPRPGGNLPGEGREDIDKVAKGIPRFPATETRRPPGGELQLDGCGTMETSAHGYLSEGQIVAPHFLFAPLFFKII